MIGFYPMDVLQKDTQFLGRDVSPVPVEVVRTEGSYVYDASGRRYIDFLMGWCVGNIGWGVPEVEKAIADFDGPDYVNPYYLYKPWAQLAEILAGIAPGKLTKTFRATGGTEAVEISLQAAMSHTKRKKFISVEGAYHGHSLGVLSVGKSDYRKWYHNLLPDCQKINPPLDERAGYRVEALLKKKDVAAYISEPIICNLAVEKPTKEYFEIVQNACRKYGTVFIIDEVATGFGRTGAMFASELYGLEPDILCLGKAITGGYGVLGAAMMTEELAKSMAFDFSFYSTYGWHPRNTVAALANVRYVVKHKETILKNVREQSEYFTKRLHAMRFRYPTEIRIEGLAIGLEMKQKGYFVNVMNRCMKKGVLVSELGPLALTLFPALVIDRKTAQDGLDVLESCL